MKTLTIILIFISSAAISQDTIFFANETEAYQFEDSVNMRNSYPRQDAITFDVPDVVSEVYLDLITKVHEKGLTQSDTLWVPMMRVTIGDTLWYDDLRYEVLQSHITASHWTPDIVPALFVLRPTASCPEWVQPTGGHDAYNIDDCVTRNGIEYISNIDANTVDPEIYNDEDSPWSYWDKPPYDN